MDAITDICLYEAGDGGEIDLSTGDIATVKGIYNQVYLALFSGNVEQSTSASLTQVSSRLDWWGNHYLDEADQFNSIFERTLQEIALNSNGLAKLVQAAKQDLAYLQEIATVQVSAEITGVNKLKLTVRVEEPKMNNAKIIFIWDGTKKELIQNITI